MEYLTERQLEVLAFIRKSIDHRGIAPTLREISDRLGCSSTAAGQKHVNVLIKKGYLKRDKHQKRGLVLTRRSKNLEFGPGVDRSAPSRETENPATVDLPLLGAVAAGSPIESFSDGETISVPPGMLRGGNHYVLRVRGDSMIEDGIHDGDMVVVQHREEASDGETVVALVNGEVTLKKLFRAADRSIHLVPANATMEPIVCRADEVSVQGIVVGLLRRY